MTVTKVVAVALNATIAANWSCAIIGCPSSSEITGSLPSSATIAASQSCAIIGCLSSYEITGQNPSYATIAANPS